MSVIFYSREVWGVCKCGHYDWQHDDSVINEDGLPVARSDGHGRCGHGAREDEPCGCKQFTWVRSIPHRRNVLGDTPKLEAEE